MNIENLFRLKEPARVISIFNLSNELMENDIHEDLSYVASIIGKIISEDIEQLPHPKINHEDLEKMVKNFFDQINRRHSINIPKIIPASLKGNERVETAFLLLLNIPEVVEEMKNTENMEKLTENTAYLSKLFAVLYMFDDIYGTQLHHFINSMYEITESFEFNEAFLREYLNKMLIEKPDLFRDDISF